MTEYGKYGKPRSRLSTLPTFFGNPFWDAHIPTASTAGMYLKSTIKEKRESQIYGPSTARDL